MFCWYILNVLFIISVLTYCTPGMLHTYISYFTPQRVKIYVHSIIIAFPLLCYCLFIAHWPIAELKVWSFICLSACPTVCQTIIPLSMDLENHLWLRNYYTGNIFVLNNFCTKFILGPFFCISKLLGFLYV